MAKLMLFHHAHGLTDGIEDFGDRFRAAGHEVLVPDLYSGLTFDALEDGVAHAETLGFETLLESAAAFADKQSTRLVYGGFSLGALAAHRLAQTRPGATGALLFHYGDVPLSTFGDEWPKGVEVQLHISEGDEFLDTDVATGFVERAAQSAPSELFLYPGSEHLFTDSSLPGYDVDSAALVVERCLALLDRVT